MLILGPKTAHFPHFMHNKNFYQKKSSITSLYLMNPNFMQNIRRNKQANTLRKDVTNERTDRDGQTQGQSLIHRTLWQSQESKRNMQNIRPKVKFII